MAAKTDTSPETPDTGTICAAETVLPAEPDPAAASGPRFCSAACFHAWHRHQHDEVVTVLHSLDPDRSGGTGVVADWLRCRGGPQNVTQLALCEFLGYQLPVLAGSVAERRAIAASLGTVFTAARLTCPEKFSSGANGWGTTMGEAEVQAYESTAAMLELAVTAGYLRPGTTGWRVRQVQLTRAYLHADVDGTSRLDAIRTERVEAWSRSRGTGRRRLVGEVASRVRAPLAIPSELLDRMEERHDLSTEGPAGRVLARVPADEAQPLRLRHLVLRHRKGTLEGHLVRGPFVVAAAFVGAHDEALGKHALARRDRHKLGCEQLQDRLLPRRRIGQLLFLAAGPGAAKRYQQTQNDHPQARCHDVSDLISSFSVRVTSCER